MLLAFFTFSGASSSASDSFGAKQGRQANKPPFLGFDVVEPL
jgi:hypothetical protein